ncbi:reverse transcriptase domain-containing protein [Tanacetum coccineum]
MDRSTPGAPHGKVEKAITNLIQLVQANPFYGRESENPHAHINSFKKITLTLLFRNVPNDVIKLMMFPYSLEGAAKTCLNENEQDSLNVATGGNLLSKTTREALNIIENKSKVRYSRNRSNASRMNATSSKTDERIDKLADQLSTLVEIVSKKVVTPAPVKAVEETCVTCGGAHSWYNCPATDNNQASVCATTGTYNQVNPPNRVSNQMAPPGFAPEYTAQIPPLVIPISIPEPDVSKTLPKTTPIPESNILKNLPKPNIPYPSRRDDQKSRDKASNQMEKIFQIFQDLYPFFERELLLRTLLLKKLPEKLGDPGKFLIPCNFSGMDVCHTLADLGASINLMPLSFWKKLSLPELTPTRMTLELADRSITYPKGLAEEVFVKVGEISFSYNFVRCRFRSRSRVPLITGEILFEETTTRYSSTNDKSVNRIDIIDAVCEEYAPELLGFSNSSGGNPTPTSESFTSEFILEEIEAYLKDDLISPEIDHADCNPEEDICLIKKLLNNDPFQLPPMDLKQSEVTEAKYSIEEPPELELKDLPSYLEYAFLEENDKLPVIIAKGLKNDE